MPSNRFVQEFGNTAQPTDAPEPTPAVRAARERQERPEEVCALLESWWEATRQIERRAAAAGLPLVDRGAFKNG